MERVLYIYSLLVGMLVTGSLSISCTNYTSPPSDLTNTSAVADYIKLNVNCSTSTITAAFSKCALIAMGSSGNVSLYNSSGSPISGSSCMPLLLDNQTTIEYVFMGNFSDCASSVEVTSTTTAYNYEVKNVDHLSINAIISRDLVLLVQFSCIFQTEYNISLDSSINVVTQTVNVTTVSNAGSFGQRFDLFNDSSFLYAYSANEIATLQITVPHRIFFGITITGADPNRYLIQGTACWVTPSSDPNDPNKYYMLQNSCPTIDNSFADANIVYNNYNSTSLKMGFRSFLWASGTASLNINCQYSVCDYVANASCSNQPTCPSNKRRRSLFNQQGTNRVATFGPINVIKPSASSCDQNNGGCSHKCITLQNNEIMCDCPFNYVLTQDNKNCESVIVESSQEAANIFHRDKPNDSGLLGYTLTTDQVQAIFGYAVILTAIVFLVMIVDFVTVCKQRRLFRKRDTGMKNEVY